MATKFGTNDDEYIFGTDEADTIYGFSGMDVIFGDDDDDTIFGGHGADTIHGGWGWDMASYYDSDEGVIVSLMTGEGSGGTAEGDHLVEIEWLEGSLFDDILEGDDGFNTLRGHSGDDVLKGGGGVDELHGMENDDILLGGNGADKLYGGDGIDTAAYYEASAGVTVDLMAGSGDYGEAEGDTYWSIENAIGSAHADLLIGNDDGNRLEGRSGQDTLKGGGGADSLWGGGDDDVLIGNDAADTLRGEAGKDQLIGGAGMDFLFGGAAADTFVWHHADETGLTAMTADRLYDFSAAQGDRLHLGGVDANVYTAGNQAFTFIGTAAFSGAPGEVRYYQAGGNTYIEMQTGTSADVEGVIRLNGIHMPEASWFVL